jgi:hypothetical protein
MDKLVFQNLDPGGNFGHVVAVAHLQMPRQKIFVAFDPPPDCNDAQARRPMMPLQ